MSIADDLHSALGSVAAGGCWPLVAEQGVTVPFIVYQDVVSQTENTLQGATNLQNTRMQIDGYAKTYAAVRTLGTAIDAAMAGATFRNVKLSSQILFESEIKLFRVMSDFSIWSTN